MTTTNHEQTATLHALWRIVRADMVPRPYHGPTHALDVYRAADRIARFEGCSVQDRYLLRSAALLHDLISVPGATDNEERTAELASEILPAFSYSAADTATISGLILATKLTAHPATLLERIIRDADLDNLGRSDFLAKNEALRTEFNAPDARPWYERTLAFLEGHQYHTASATRLRAAGKAGNYAALERHIAEAFP